MAKINILIVDDEPMIRALLENTMHRTNYPCWFAENGEKALEIIAAQPVDVVVTDIDMPVMDGLTLCRQIKNDPELKEIYVVMFSSLINDQMVIKCKKAMADAYVTKPEINQLIQILDKRC